MTRALASLACAAALACSPGLAVAQECAGGRIASEASAFHCCWPGQTWGAQERACIGPPACPGALVAHGEQCVAASAPVSPPIAQPVVQPITPFMQPVTPAVAQVAPAAVDVRVVPDGAPDWPSSVAAPTADVNPRFVREAGDPGLIAAGTTVFLIGYLTAFGFGIGTVSEQGIHVVRGSFSYYEPGNYDGTCHDTTGALAMIPVIGSIAAMIAYGACTVPELDRVEDSSGRFLGYQTTGNRRGMGNSGLFAWAVPTAVFQVLGFGLFLGGITGSHQSFVVGAEAGGDHARLTIQPYAPGAQVGLSLRVDL